VEDARLRGDCTLQHLQRDGASSVNVMSQATAACEAQLAFAYTLAQELFQAKSAAIGGMLDAQRRGVQSARAQLESMKKTHRTRAANSAKRQRKEVEGEEKRAKKFLREAEAATQAERTRSAELIREKMADVQAERELAECREEHEAEREKAEREADAVEERCRKAILEAEQRLAEVRRREEELAIAASGSSAELVQMEREVEDTQRRSDAELAAARERCREREQQLRAESANVNITVEQARALGAEQTREQLAELHAEADKCCAKLKSAADVTEKKLAAETARMLKQLEQGLEPLNAQLRAIEAERASLDKRRDELEAANASAEEELRRETAELRQKERDRITAEKRALEEKLEELERSRQLTRDETDRQHQAAAGLEADFLEALSDQRKYAELVQQEERAIQKATREAGKQTEEAEVFEKKTTRQLADNAALERKRKKPSSGGNAKARRL